MAPPGGSPRGKKDKDAKDDGGPYMNVPTFVSRCDDLLDDDQATELVRKLFESRIQVRNGLQPVIPNIFHKLNSQVQKELKEVSGSFEKEKMEASRRLHSLEASLESIRQENAALRLDLQNREKASGRAERDLRASEAKLAQREKEVLALRPFKAEALAARRRSPSPSGRMKTPRAIKDEDEEGN